VEVDGAHARLDQMQSDLPASIDGEVRGWTATQTGLVAAASFRT